MGIFQDNNAKIHQALVVKEWSIRTHECQGRHEESFSHMNSPLQSPDFTPLKVFWMCWKRLKEWYNSAVIRPKINATMDGNKCCDIA